MEQCRRQDFKGMSKYGKTNFFAGGLNPSTDSTTANLIFLTAP